MIKRILSSKTKLGIGVIIILMLVMGLSYGTFTFVTQDYRASELLIAELNYGIKIEVDANQACTVNGTQVNTPANSECFATIQISSVNPINSRYALAYKNLEGDAKVEYTDKTQWGSTGIIDSYDSNYTRKVRVVIDNTGKNGQAVTDFKVYGGYTFNSEVSIDLENGYQTIPGGYEESVNVGNKRLVDIIEKDTDCVTKNNKECLYGGGTITNYLQYPTSKDPKVNLWRITGSYQVDGETIAKIVYNSNYNGNTTQDQIRTILNTFYGTLDKADTIIQNTDKFNCSKGSCTVSDYSKLGLLSTYEYEQAGGYESYLSNQDSWFALESGSIKNITPSGIVDASEASGIRPAAYLQTGVNVTGKGTIDDPYRISPKGDINILAYTLNGQSTNETLQSLLSSKIVNQITCENKSEAYWDYEKRAIVIEKLNTPETCTIDFGEGYIVNIDVTGGKATPSSIGIGVSGEGQFKVKTDSHHMLRRAKVSCDQATITIDESSGNVTLSNINQSQNCKVTLESNSLFNNMLVDNPLINIRSDFSKPFNELGIDAGLYKEDNEQFLEEDGKKEDINAVYYFVGDVDNNWVVFGDFWWRIIRTNEDGSVRLLYAGKAEKGLDGKYTGHDQQDGIIDTETFIYNSTNGTMYVGYMYGTTGSLENNRKNDKSSTIKEKVDKWYIENMGKTDGKSHFYGSYLSKTAVYCNDRSTNKYSSSSYMVYANNLRGRPSFKCGSDQNGKLYEGTGEEGQSGGADKADRFTAENSSNVGNENLTYPIALITADEIVYAGGYKSKQSPKTYYYLNSAGESVTGEQLWWTMSPLEYDSSQKARMAFVYASRNPGYLGSTPVTSSYGIRPVLSLKFCIGITGTGTTTDPYIPTIDDACAAADN